VYSHRSERSRVAIERVTSLGAPHSTQFYGSMRSETLLHTVRRSPMSGS
jgi:hypothetical protein